MTIEKQENELIDSPEELKVINSKEGEKKNFAENAPDIELVKAQLIKSGLELIGEREALSRGVFGPLFRMKVHDLRTGEDKYVSERTFVRNRYESLNPISGDEEDGKREDSMVVSTDSGKTYKNLQKESDNDAIIVDHLYDEAAVLDDLQELTGVPETYGAVYQGEKGSLLEEFIVGSDLQEAMMSHEISDSLELATIWEKIKNVYIEAAKRGYVGLDTTGTTIMIDADNHQPYLTDWYNCSRGSIEVDGPVKRQYLAGLKAIDERISELSSWSTVAA
ncbi:MAG: hypothetical protein NT165_02905 [Candidatus Falkowbacteria bacterium]|nr:hypothetical protein [Candidatus Falkowbacteria bacterium]